MTKSLKLIIIHRSIDFECDSGDMEEEQAELMKFTVKNSTFAFNIRLKPARACNTEKSWFLKDQAVKLAFSSKCVNVTRINDDDDELFSSL